MLPCGLTKQRENFLPLLLRYILQPSIGFPEYPARPSLHPKYTIRIIHGIHFIGGWVDLPL